MKRSWIARCAVVALLAGTLAIPVASSADVPAPMPVNPDRQCSADNLQTFDPLSPPCIPFWQGDNGGAKGKGVGATEVRMVLWYAGGINYISGSDPSNRVTPTGALYDLFKTPQQNQVDNRKSPSQPEHLVVMGARVWQDYFNRRFETYNRKLHLYVYFSECAGGCYPEQLRAEFTRVDLGVDPYAVVPGDEYTPKLELANVAASRGSVFVGTFGGVTASFNAIEPNLVWNRWPSVERQADLFASFVCARVVGRPASLAGGELAGMPRKFGLLYTTDPDHPTEMLLAHAVRDRVEACGGEVVGEATYAECCSASQTSENAADFAVPLTLLRLKGATSILWPGGFDGSYPRAATTTLYRPEWFIAGDGIGEGNAAVRLAAPGDVFDRHAIVVTPAAFEPSLGESYCARAFREIAPTFPPSDAGYVCHDYDDLHLLVKGIQITGPNLTPATMDTAYHSIPAVASTGPRVAACWFPAGDHTCIKDAQVKWWDAAYPAAAGTLGCWRSFDDGRRSLPGAWIASDVATSVKATDPCDAYSRPIGFNLA